MDWSKIKNIFIITFLILDLYLIYEIIGVHQLNKFDVKAETESSIEMMLKADRIEYVTLPKDYVQDYYLTAKPKIFTTEDIQDPILSNQNVTIITTEEQDSKMEGQNSTLSNQKDVAINKGTMLESILKEPIKITEKTGANELNQYIKENVLYGSHYQFLEKSSDESVITYTQRFNTKKLFENQNSELTFHINDSNEIYKYTQTFLEEIQELSNPEKVIQPIKAIEILFLKKELPPKSKITNVELGYYTLVPFLSDTPQVLNPAWSFEVEGKGRLYVSAIEGEIITELNQTTIQKKVME